jgi:hypothetical protein
VCVYVCVLDSCKEKKNETENIFFSKQCQCTS